VGRVTGSVFDKMGVRTIADLLGKSLPERCPGIRLLGVGMSGFESANSVQRTLFDDAERDKNRQLDAAADEIPVKFGAAALSRGSGLRHGARHRPEPRPYCSGGEASEPVTVRDAGRRSRPLRRLVFLIGGSNPSGSSLTSRRSSERRC